jgi:hypothetical protein
MRFSNYAGIWEKNFFKLHLTSSQQYSANTIPEIGHLQRLPQTVTMWFELAPLDVASYDIEMKIEIRLWKLRSTSISRCFCEEVAAAKGAEAHTLGTTALIYNFNTIHSLFWDTVSYILELYILCYSPRNSS